MLIIIEDKMPNIRRILICLMIIFCFAAGYAARTTLSGLSLVSSPSQNNLGAQVASSNLDGTGVDLRPAETLVQILHNLNGQYVEQIKPADQGRMTYDMLKAMLGSLNDPNSRFVSLKEKLVIDDSLNGKFHGIGAITSIKSISFGGVKEEHLIIDTVLPGGASEQAGLFSGDDIVEIDGKSVLPYDPYSRANKMVSSYKDDGTITNRNAIKKKLETEQSRIDKGMPIVEAESILSTADNKELELGILRFGIKKIIKVKPKEFTLNPIETSIPSVGIGLLRINYFGNKTPEAVTEAINSFKDKNIKSVILDLRRVFGGDMDSLVKTAGVFEAGKPIGILQKSRNRKSTINASAQSAANWDGKLVVLVDKGTARLPELFASSLAINNKAIIIGQATAGDPVDVSLFQLQDGSAVSLRTGKYLTSDGIDLTGKGIKVDYKIAALSGIDNYLEQAVKVLNIKAAK